MEVQGNYGGRAVSDKEDIQADAMLASQQQLRLHRFREWLQVNGMQSRSCEIKPSSKGVNAGFGVFSTQDGAQGVLMVTPLLLAITPMTVLQDPLLGPHYGRLFEEGEVDDRLLIMLFLIIEHARGQSSFWAPYLDMLPSKFGTPLCYSEEELLELKGTSLFHATRQQLRSLRCVFDEKVKIFADAVLSTVESERREVDFQDFMWANSIFWTRALNIPCSHSFVFPAQLPVPLAVQALQSGNVATYQQPVSGASGSTDCVGATNQVSSYSEAEESTMDKVQDNVTADPIVPLINNTTYIEVNTERMEPITDMDLQAAADSGEDGELVRNLQTSANGTFEESTEAAPGSAKKPSTVWVEGLVPGIDFCNHDHKAIALWEVDGPHGFVTGIPNSMYLVTGPELSLPSGAEILISYGNKGNEELLYLYGFVMETNPDDYLMVYFPKQALDDSVCSDTKSQLLAELKLPLRWLLPSSELKRGFYGHPSSKLLFGSEAEPHKPFITGHSWSGTRNVPAHAEKIVFPEDLVTVLRIVAMGEDEVYRVVAMLEGISDPGVGRVPTDVDIKAAVWEVCGNAGALYLLTDLLTSRMVELEEGTGTEDMDTDLLVKDKRARMQIEDHGLSNRSGGGDGCRDVNLLSDNKRACVLYRMGQKRLCHLFLKEAEMALENCGG